MNRVYSLKDVNTASPQEVADAVVAILDDLFPDSKPSEIHQLIEKARKLFHGEIPPYQANDLAYHDLEHTLQVCLCWVRMLHNFNSHDPHGPTTWIHCKIGIAAALLHDTGYLKENSDETGTGAKYTFIHESRSCRIAEHFLTSLDWHSEEINSVKRLIAATGPRAIINSIPFASLIEERMAQMLATSDFLAQMSDPQYLDKLPGLYAEFEESDEFRGLDRQERSFPDLKTLISQTPHFWEHFVKPRLKKEYSDVVRYLNQPFPDGDNPYLSQANENVSRIKGKRSAISNE